MEINLVINNKEDINYINQLNEYNKTDTLLTALSIGIKAITMCNIEMNGLSYYEPIKDLISDKLSTQTDDVKHIINILEDLMNIKQNSSRKGKLGESLAVNSLIKKYPDWKIENISATGHEGDCCIYSDKYGKILYEFKTYTTNVNKEEIYKFKKDVDSTNSLYGIFISHTSGIVGKKMIDVELYNNKILIYVSNSGLNGHGIELATELLLQLINSNILDNKFILKLNEHQSYIKELNDHMHELKECNNNYSRLSSQIIESKQQISNIMDHLYKKTYDYHMKGIHTLNNIISIIKEHNLDNNYSMKIIDDLENSQFINSINNDEHKYYLIKIYDIINKYDIKMSHNDSNDIVYYTKQILSKIML